MAKRIWRPARLAACCLVAVASLAGGCGRQPAEERPDETSVYLERIRGVNRLTLATMRLTKMATIADMNLDEAEGTRQMAAALVDAVKIGDRKAAYSYDTYMRAYIDLSRLGTDDIELDPDTRRGRIMLPPVETEFDGRDFGMREDYYRVTGLRSRIGSEERARLKEEMNTRLRQEVEGDEEFRKTLAESGRRRAELYFRQLFASAGYDVEVSFRN